MKKDDLNVFEFHQSLEKKINESVPIQIKRQSEIELALQNINLSYTDELSFQKELNHIHHQTQLQKSYQEYIYLVTPIILQYKELLNCTIKDTFTFTKKKKIVSPEIMSAKKKCIDEYLSIIRSFPLLSCFLPVFHSEQKLYTCSDCDVEYERFETHMICPKCYCEQTFLYQDEPVSFKDLSRINNNMKFSYIRQTHFKDTIKQFQGKQNKFIDPTVYETLRKCIVDSGLGLPNQSTYKITKDHIKMFLQENSLYKYYEDMNLIYYQLTGIPCPDISMYEKQLLEDFEKVLDSYDRVIKEDENNYTRTNFLNSYYVLYQLLKKNNFPCKEHDFPIIKTIDRKIEHDEIYEKCCEILGWSFHPTV